MALKAHLQSLSQRHQELEAMLSMEMKHPHPDDTRVHELKRLKLRIKDQIERLRQDESSPN
ncbi:MAG: YdcH family protein [Pseudomonadota bacterium]